MCYEYLYRTRRLVFLILLLDLIVRVQGVIIHGAIRDSAEIAKLPLGCKALGTMPRKSEKKVPGEPTRARGG